MLNKLRGALDKGVATVSVKSETLIEVSRTKNAINNAQNRLSEQINTMGIHAYNAYKAGALTLDVFTEDLNLIAATEQELADLNAHLIQVQEDERRLLAEQQAPKTGACFCMNCGKALPAGSRFCDECGTPVQQ